jgi:pantoate--beta-alanine ligase
MKRIRSIPDMVIALTARRQSGCGIPLVVGLVPTMGALHEGHLAMVRQARKECDVVVVSIFVNPLQFGRNEDYLRYPRDIEADVRRLRQENVDLLFHPDRKEIYPTCVFTEDLPAIPHIALPSSLTQPLCGQDRPGHFEGVATIVSILFHLLSPDRAYFGLKDVQQVAVIRQMVERFFFQVTIVSVPPVREADGLAMSSRNQGLTPEERREAPILYRALQETKEKIKRGAFATTGEAVDFLRRAILVSPLVALHYASLLSYPSLRELDSLGELGAEEMILAVAAQFGKVRLIDNLIFFNNEMHPQRSDQSR